MITHWTPRIIALAGIVLVGFIIIRAFYTVDIAESSEGAMGDVVPRNEQGTIVDQPIFVEVIDSNDRTEARDAVNDYLRGVPVECIRDIELELGNKHIDNFVYYIERSC